MKDSASGMSTMSKEGCGSNRYLARKAARRRATPITYERRARRDLDMLLQEAADRARAAAIRRAEEARVQARGLDP
jgi:hypothetical protein